MDAAQRAEIATNTLSEVAMRQLGISEELKRLIEGDTFTDEQQDELRLLVTLVIRNDKTILAAARRLKD